MDKLKVGLISLGCDKNRIDSEIILGKISKIYEIVNDAKKADIIIVNTCGFIEASKQEAIETILEMAEYKKNYRCKGLIATGCLTQRYGEELLELIPEIDVILGTNNYDMLIESIEALINENKKSCHCNYSDIVINEGDRIITTGSRSAYIRIAEGCSDFCTYCIIPKIRGKFRSRQMENIIDEAKLLIEKGVKEIILVAQDTTKYGIDIYGEKKLPELIRKISEIDGIEWVRVLYCYPEEITDELIQELSNNSKVCRYLDMPIQHISNNVLKRMGRRGRKEMVVDVINKMRAKIDGLVLRTSIIVGFPGETDEDFNELKEFVKDIKFDKLGVFKYSQEEDTPAAIMPEQIEDEVKEQRERDLMLLQQQVSKEINNNKIGKVYDVIVEGRKGSKWHGRNYEMAPEIDGEIFFKYDKIVNIGDIIKIKVTECSEYDLMGVVCNESCE